MQYLINIKNEIIFFFFYSYDHSRCTLSERKEGLTNFECNCVACEKDYPLLDDAPSANIPNIITEDMLPKMREMDKKFAMELTQMFSKYLNEYAEHYPCEQLMSIENLYHVCFEIAYSTEIPLEFQYE